MVFLWDQSVIIFVSYRESVVADPLCLAGGTPSHPALVLVSAPHWKDDAIHIAAAVANPWRTAMATVPKAVRGREVPVRGC